MTYSDFERQIKIVESDDEYDFMFSDSDSDSD